MGTHNLLRKAPLLIRITLSLAVIFFAGVANANAQSTPATAAASFIGFDKISQGNWQGKYGRDGYSIASNAQMIPTYASFAAQNPSKWTWTGDTTDSRALLSGNRSGRMATTWYNNATFSFDVNLTDGKPHQIALYAVDWDLRSRSETIQIVDAKTGAVLNVRSISSFTSGTYIIWNISGHVTINVTSAGGPNAVVSGIFFSAGSSPTLPNAATVNFASVDPTTEGNWQGKYGSDGYSIASNAQMMPTYTSFAVQNPSKWTWTGNTTDSRALLSGNSSGRMATTWYNNATFSFDVNLTDANSHQIALYAVDWDLRSRSETIQIVDANSGAVLDSRKVSSFSSGIYLIWNIRGHVTIDVTSTGGPNAVVSGIFFSASSNPTIPNTAVAPVITTQPASQTVSVGQSATFSVAETGSAPLSYQWMKNGAAISGATSSSYKTSATAAADSGSQFSVVLANSAGSATSSAALLTVKGGTLILNTSSTSLSFGSVNISSSSTRTATLRNAGTASVTVSNVAVSGAGFNASGIPVGTILAPGQSATLSVMFAPAASGNATGSVTVSSNATSGAQVIALSGQAVAASVAHTVSLSWSTSTSAVIGYNVYFTTVSGSQYTRLTANPTPTASYDDSGIEAAQTRYYVVTSVNSSNEESGYSNEVAAIVP